MTKQLVLLFSILLISELAMGQADHNLLKEEYESSGWRLNVQKKEGDMVVSEQSPASGQSYLELMGRNEGAKVEAVSPSIKVKAGASYKLGFSFKTVTGSGRVSVRWKDGGYMFSFASAQPQWATLEQALAGRTILGKGYAKTADKLEDGPSLKEPILIIPENVSEIILVLTVTGENAVSLDNITLAEVLPVQAQQTNPQNSIDQEEGDRLKATSAKIEMANSEGVKKNAWKSKTSS